MSSTSSPSNASSVVIVGAGPAGALLALLLGRRGYRVDVVERRGEPTAAPAAGDEGRSINLGLSHRGIVALRTAGVIDAVMAEAVRARGRVIHATDGRLEFQPYGATDAEILYSIRRGVLLRELVRAAQALENVRFHFDTRCESLDIERPRIVARRADGTALDLTPDFVVGADGAFSPVRGWMHRSMRADFDQEFLDWGYKELTIPGNADGTSPIALEALHIWPRTSSLVVTHPNRDGSHTLSLFYPWEGEGSVAELADEQSVMRFFRTHLPDIVPLVPNLAAEFLRHPAAALVSVRTFPWHYRDRVVLVGDACHAVYPFYGQGMNASLEDCLTLDAAFSAHPRDRAAAFGEYVARRKVNADALRVLVRRNFDELRDTANQPAFVARKKVDLLLSRLFPGRWMPLYTMVSHTTMPYAEALARHERQMKLLRRLGVELVLSLMLPVVVALKRAFVAPPAAPAAPAHRDEGADARLASSPPARPHVAAEAHAHTPTG